MSPAMLANLLGNIAEVRSENAEKEARVRASQDRRPYSSNDNVIRPSQLGDGVSFLAKTPVVAQAAMHPVSLWLIESYLKVESLHYCQVPSIGGLRPAEKTGDSAKVLAGGWHSDCASPLLVACADGSLLPVLSALHLQTRTRSRARPSRTLSCLATRSLTNSTLQFQRGIRTGRTGRRAWACSSTSH